MDDNWLRYSRRRPVVRLVVIINPPGYQEFRPSKYERLPRGKHVIYRAVYLSYERLHQRIFVDTR